jgi:uncharacterized membrane protein
MVLAEEVATQGEGSRMHLRLRDALALTTVTYLLCVSAKILYPQSYTDILFVYYAFVVPTNNGIPYHDYSVFTASAGYVYSAIPSILIWVSGHAPNVESFLATMAFLTYFFVIGIVYFLYRICAEFQIDRGRIIAFFAVTPSFLVLSFYSWDITAACCVVAALYYALKKKARLTGFWLGLGFAAKAFPLLLLPVFLKEARTWSDRFEMLSTAALGVILPSLPFMIIDFHGWFFTALYPSGGTRWGVYLENSIWLVVSYYQTVPGWLIAAATWSLILLAILHVTYSRYSLIMKLWLIEAATILIFPSYPPQFNVWLIPLFALNPVFPLIPFLAFDFLNTAIILSWFTVDPSQAWGPVWDMFLARIVILVLLLIWAARRSIKDQPFSLHNLMSREPPPHVE